jgi:HEPN domain-containing protein
MISDDRSTADPSVGGMLKHAEISYVATRVLFLSSEVLHPPALYMGAQTIEKGLKAILLHRDEKVERNHKLVALAERVGDPFNDAEFLALCTSLEPFEIAGRYDDGHDYESWRYSLDLLSLLDVFIVRIRSMIDRTPDGYVNRIATLLIQQSKGNLVMQGAEQALKDNNRMLEFAVQPWLVRQSGNSDLDSARTAAPD